MSVVGYTGTYTRMHSRDDWLAAVIDAEEDRNEVGDSRECTGRDWASIMIGLWGQIT